MKLSRELRIYLKGEREREKNATRQTGYFTLAHFFFSKTVEPETDIGVYSYDNAIDEYADVEARRKCAFQGNTVEGGV